MITLFLYRSRGICCVMETKPNQVGENSSFTLACVKSVARYHFKLAYVILQMAVKELFKTHF